MRQLEIEFSSWGGAREGAGRRRRPGAAPCVAHRRRERHAKAHPVHVTLRARRGLPPFRERVLAAHIRECIRLANRAAQGAFRVVHFSVQRDHLHLVVEASDSRALARGVQGLAIRVARGINGLLGKRGRVWGDRYHARELATPRAVRDAIVYVLMNGKKHGTAGAVDACSSAPWFDGFVHPIAPAPGEPPVHPPGTWLGQVGWRRHGLVGFDERPRSPG